MNGNIALIYKKPKLQQPGSDFSFWQTRSYEERIAALEEICSEYHAWEQTSRKEAGNVQPGFQRVYRIFKR